MTQLHVLPTNQLTYVPQRMWRISVERYHEMIAAELLTEDDRLELLQGYLIEKMTVNPPHAYVTETIREVLGRFVPETYFVNAQQPITTDDSEPEPDVTVVKGRRRDFLNRHPSPGEIALLVEVSDATLEQDQTWKKRIYAHAGIAVYWIVNLRDRQIEVHSRPADQMPNPVYQQLNTYHESNEIPVVLDDQEIAHLSVHDLLP